MESCSVLLYLNDETLFGSEWCQHEVNEARRYGIPIIVIGAFRLLIQTSETEGFFLSVDVDKQTAQSVIDKYMEHGWSWLFSEQ